MRLATLMLASLTCLFSQGCVSSFARDGSTPHVESCSAYEVCQPVGGGHADSFVPLALGTALLGAMSVAVVRHVAAAIVR